MNFLIESLVFVSSGMLIPCVSYLFILLGESLNKAARSLRNYQKQVSQVDEVANWIRNDRQSSTFPQTNLKNEFGDCCTALIAAETKPLASHLLAEYETHCEKRLSSLSRLARLGPMTGLLGTLIPMGPALDGLANGDMAQLAGQMQVAFTTTVIGLLIGAVGFVLMQREAQLTRRQLATLDYLCDAKTAVSEQ